MKTVDEDIDRIRFTLSNLERVDTPSAEMLYLIKSYREELVYLQRRSEKYFTPYRDEGGRLIINHVGDSEDDI